MKSNGDVKSLSQCFSFLLFSFGSDGHSLNGFPASATETYHQPSTEPFFSKKLQLFIINYISTKLYHLHLNHMIYIWSPAKYRAFFLSQSYLYKTLKAICIFYLLHKLKVSNTVEQVMIRGRKIKSSREIKLSFSILFS